MFKNRDVTIKLGKKTTVNTEEEPEDVMSFDDKTDKILEVTERLAKKAFIGVAVYIVLDTWRQTSIEKSKYDPYER